VVMHMPLLKKYRQVPSWKLNALISFCAVEIRCSYLELLFYQAQFSARRKWKSNVIDWWQNSPWKSWNQLYFSAANFVANQSDWFYFSIHFAQNIRLVENAVLFCAIARNAKIFFYSLWKSVKPSVPDTMHWLS
jgi:hypothetical protein